MFSNSILQVFRPNTFTIEHKLLSSLLRGIELGFNRIRKTAVKWSKTENIGHGARERETVTNSKNHHSKMEETQAQNNYNTVYGRMITE